MKPIAEQFQEMSASQRRGVLMALCEFALNKWKGHTASAKPIHYRESVCGTRQSVDLQLPFDALESAREGIDIANVKERYGEPIAALQDDDLRFPEPVLYAYYSIYNLFRKYAIHEEIEYQMILNQAIASETDETKWVPMLESAIRQSNQAL